ncbi:T9SS type A sorting domain-containing protein [bacterium]|nr:T9SS type A sorting domain-containing protein [bacterium]
MYRAIIFLLVLMWSATVTHAQPDSLWSRLYGTTIYNRCLSALQTSDGGYALAGEADYIGGGFALIKTDQNGDTLWARCYSREIGGSRVCYSVQQTTDGGFILAGSAFTLTNLSKDYMIVKTDSLGDSLWTCGFGGSEFDECYCVYQTSDGGYLLGGYSESYGAGQEDFYIVKLDADGDSLWSRTYGGELSEECNAVLETSDGGYLMAGSTESFGNGREFVPDIWILKTDCNGDSLWSRTYGDDGREVCYSMLETSEGGYVLAGFDHLSVGWEDFLLLKVDEFGDSLWYKTYGDTSQERCNSIYGTSDGGYIMGGFTRSYGAGREDWWVLKVNSNGDSLWSQPFGGESMERCMSVQQTMDGGYMYAGYTGSFSDSEWRIWLIKTGPDSTPLPPGPFMRVLPEDSSQLGPDLELDFAWTTSVDPNGDAVAYMFQLESPTFPSEYFSPSDTVTSDTTVTVTFAMFTDNMDDDHDFYWTVCAIAGGDTVGAENGQGFFTKYIIESADQGPALPSEYSLSVYPNPFNPSTTISFDVPQQSHVSLNVYDLLGREVAQLVNGTITAGAHQVNWDCSSCATGLYIIELRSGTHRCITKAMLPR